MEFEDAFKKYLEAAVNYRVDEIIKKLHAEAQRIKQNPPSEHEKIDAEINKFEIIRRFVDQVIDRK